MIAVPSGNSKVVINSYNNVMANAMTIMAIFIFYIYRVDVPQCMDYSTRAK